MYHSKQREGARSFFKENWGAKTFYYAILWVFSPLKMSSSLYEEMEQIENGQSQGVIFDAEIIRKRGVRIFFKDQNPYARYYV